MKILRMATLLWMVMLCLSPSAALGADAWQIEFNGEVTPSQAQWIEQIYQEAEEASVDQIVMILDTPGGRIDSALDISQTMQDVPTIVLVEGGAISAGSFIALSAERYYMLQGATIGAAEPRIGTEKADEKTVSFWAAQLAAMAEKNGRDAQIARSMADEDISIEGLVERGKLLTLTAGEALSLGMTDGVYDGRDAFFADQGIEISRDVFKEPSDRLADLLTSSVVSTVLLMLGLAGIFIELFTPGFGVPGAIGFAALSLYFGGSMLAGLSGWEAVFLFLLGVVLIVAEVFFIPGFGVAGIGGFIAIFASIFLAAPDATTAVRSIVVALLGAIVLVVLLIRVLPTRKAFSRIILHSETDNDSGYVAIRDGMDEWTGRRGVAITHLRPAGTVRIDGEIVDALTRGSYISEDTPVIVTSVVGNKVFVERYQEEEK